MNRKKVKWQLLVLGICVGSGCVVASADTSIRALPPAGIPIGTRNTTAASAPTYESPTPQRDVAVAEPSLDDFDKQRVALNATHVESADQVMQNLQILTGNVIDGEGQIMGMMVRGLDTIVLLQLHQGAISLRVPTALQNSALLVPGSTVRVLANVRGFAESPAKLTLIDIAAPSTNTQIAKIPDTSAVVLPPLDGTISALPAPPEDLAKAVAPSYSAVAQTAPTDDTAAKTSSVVPSADDVVAAQKVAYSKMIAGTNRRLKTGQADEIAEAILRAGLKHQMDPRFLAAVIGVESDYDVSCLSSSGAMGLGQIMPFNLKIAGVQDPWNPTQNVFGTARLLRGLLDEFKGRENSTLLAVAAYNAGSGAVRRAGYQVPNGAQVRRYVWKVYYRYKALAPDMF